MARYRRTHPLGARELLLAVVFSVGLLSLGATMFGYRLLSLGVYVSTESVRVRNLYRTRTIRWSEVAAVESRAATERRRRHREALWIVPRHGKPIRAPVVLPQPRYAAIVERLDMLHRNPLMASD